MGKELPSEEELSPLRGLLSFVPEERARAIEQRREQWTKKNNDLFGKNSRFNEIKRRMNDGAAFSSMDVDVLCSDMAFLASFYDHIIELEGIAVAEDTLYSRYYNDNLAIISYGNIFDGTKSESEAMIKIMIPEMKMMWNILTGAKNDLSFLGVRDGKQTARANSIKMMIEVYKKRHDSRRAQYAGSQAR